VFREKLYAAIESGELTRYMPLGSAFSIIQKSADSLEVVEIVMMVGEHGLHKSDSLEVLLNMLESEDEEYKRKHPQVHWRSWKRTQ